jgi:3-oxoacyl-[acyl-carrier protein] reductase
MTHEPRVAIITGAANGIGRATAEAFATAGYQVIGWDIAEPGGGPAELEFERVDVSDRAAVEAGIAAVIARHGQVDVLINNAGILRDARLVKLSDADWSAVIAVNLEGVFLTTQTVAPHMIQRGYGRIVNASSVVGLYGNFGQTNYVAAKSGVIGMTKVWARELGRHGVTVNAIAPGFVATEMVEQMPKPILESMVARTPVGRIGEPGDIARAYLFLADERAGFINGAILSVDGGMVVGT